MIPMSSPPSSSQRVRLEVELLDADQATPAPVSPAAPNEHTCLTVLVVAAEADLRRYVRECLRERTDLRLLQAATVTAAVHLAAYSPPDLVVVDEPESDVLLTLLQLRAIVIVDDVPREAPARATRLRFLARPFTGQELVAEVDRLVW